MENSKKNISEIKPYNWQLVGILGQYYTRAQVDTLISAESLAREKADANLQKLIEQEKTDRETKDKALQEAIDNVSASSSTITVDEIAELLVVN